MRRTLVCRLDNLGDVLLTGPAVRAVAAGSDQVTFLAGPNGACAAKLLPGVDDVMVHRAAWIDPSGAVVDGEEISTLIDGIAAVAPDRALVFSSFHQSPLPMALLLRIAGVPVIAAISDDYPGSLLDVRHRLDPEVHEVERNLSLAATLGFRLPAGDDGRLRIAPSPSPHTGGRPYVVVHPGASAPARTAARSLFAAVVDSLHEEGWDVVVTGSPDERQATAEVSGHRGSVDLGGMTGLSELAGVIAGASALVVGNTGPAHIAAAVGTPVVQVYPPTVPANRWRPWAVPHALLGNQDVSCAGCRQTLCPQATQLCVSNITPEEVIAAVSAVISDRDYLFPAHAVPGVMA